MSITIVPPSSDSTDLNVGMVDMVDSAIQGAALLDGLNRQATLARLARRLCVSSIEVESWRSGCRFPSQEHLRDLLILRGLYGEAVTRRAEVAAYFEGRLGKASGK